MSGGKWMIVLACAAVLASGSGTFAARATGDRAAKAAAAKEARESQRDERQAAAESRREKKVDERQDRQAKRIENGVKNGSLTPEELKTLENQQQSIASMETSLKGDGKLSRLEFKQLREQLDVASRCIFAEKHDGEGNTMPVYRLGKNVKLNPDVAQKLEDPNLSKTEARAFAHDFREMLRLKHELAAGKLTDAQRAKAQSQYNDLLNKYFVTM